MPASCLARWSTLSLLYALIAAGAHRSPAQTPALVKDINLRPAATPSSAPSEFVRMGDWIYFAATTASHGRELFRAPVTAGPPELVLDIVPGPDSSNPISLVVIGRTLFFTCSHPVHGDDLWKSDGAAAGTALVKDLAGSGAPQALTAVAGLLYLWADDGAHGYELWRSDGTGQGTILVQDVQPGAAGSMPPPSYVAMKAVGATLYFAADDGSTGPELWRSDGTSTGTMLVKDIHAGSPGSGPMQLTALDGTVLFSASDAEHGRELWRSDGTSAGTVLVRDIQPGTGSSLAGPFILALPAWPTLGSVVLLAADDGMSGLEPWRSDGTAAGTVLCRDIEPGSAGSDPTAWEAALSEVWFAATTAASGSELWKTDGTLAGTSLVKDIVAGPGGSQPRGIRAMSGYVLFAMGLGVLYRSDGTEAGTVALKSVLAESITPTGASTAFFNGFEPATGLEPWTTDGTSAGTSLLADLNPPVAGSLGSAPAEFSDLVGLSLFRADDGVHGAELWKSDGTDAGTALVRDIRSGSAGSNPHDLVLVGAQMLMVADGPPYGEELWRTDGTYSGTRLVRDIRPGTAGARPSGLVAVGSIAFFAADDGVHGFELWKTDGSEAGTVLVRDISPAGSSNPQSLCAYRGRLYFNARDDTGWPALWRSDGTAAGTQRVVASNAIAVDPQRLAVAGDTLFFNAVGLGVTGAELWKSDGTDAGTVLVLDIWPGTESSAPRDLTRVGSALFFRARHPSYGLELWKSDGTAAGTALVKDISSEDYPWPVLLRDLNGVLLFQASDPQSGVELWKSDGTAAGTVLVKDIRPGTESSAIRDLHVLGSRHAWLFANDGGGEALWVTDGTTSGTRRVQGRPLAGTPVSHGWFFYAWDDGVHGLEPWQLFPGATAVPVGLGCGSATRRPTLQAADPVIGSKMRVTGSDSYASAVTVLLIGIAAKTPLAVGGDCFSYVDLNGLYLPLQVLQPTGRSWSHDVDVPADAGVLGAHAVLQAWSLGTDAPLGYETTNGVQVTAGY